MSVCPTPHHSNSFPHMFHATHTLQAHELVKIAHNLEPYILQSVFLFYIHFTSYHKYHSTPPIPLPWLPLPSPQPLLTPQQPSFPLLDSPMTTILSASSTPSRPSSYRSRKTVSTVNRVSGGLSPSQTGTSITTALPLYTKPPIQRSMTQQCQWHVSRWTCLCGSLLGHPNPRLRGLWSSRVWHQGLHWGCSWRHLDSWLAQSQDVLLKRYSPHPPQPPSPPFGWPTCTGYGIACHSNEPVLWRNSRHPRVHPTAQRCLWLLLELFTEL